MFLKATWPFDSWVEKGYPPRWFISYPITAGSTIDEVGLLLQELRRRHVRKFLVVTSNYHSRRAGIAFRTLCLTCRFRVVAAPDDNFNPEMDRGFDRIYRSCPNSWQRRSHACGIA